MSSNQRGKLPRADSENMKHKSDIPNQAGFRLVLIRNNGQRIPCVVFTREDGSFACLEISTQKAASLIEI